MRIVTAFLVGAGMMVTAKAVPGLMSSLGQPIRASFPADKVVTTKTGDPEIAEARTKARASLATFWDAFEAQRTGERGYSVKIAIADNGKVEHFWVGDLKRYGTKINGRIANTPNFVTNVKFGQRYTFNEADIEDWTFLRNGKIVGNETARPLMKKLPAADAAKMLAAFESP